MAMVERAEARRVRWAGERRGTYMPRYVVLVNWTDQSIKNVKQTIERTDRAAILPRSMG